MLTVPAVRNAVVLGCAAFLGFFLARGKRAYLWLPVYLLPLVGLAFALKTVDYRFVVESIRFDPPWFTAGLLGLWCAIGGAGWLRARSWWAVVVGAILVGDYAVAIGLSLIEPDAGRRARLVLAASGASLVGPWSGASAVALGWGGPYLSALGLGLSLLGFAGGGGAPSFERPNQEAAWKAAVVPLWLALYVWAFMLAGVPDFAAMGLEYLPVAMPVHATAWVGGVAAVLGALGAEPGLSLFGQDILLHATQVRGTWVADALRVGLAVGGGLPLLMATGSKLTVGLPIWVVQVLLALAFLGWRYG